jgi:hypothetical protein
MYHSQSVLIGSTTTWFPLIDPTRVLSKDISFAFHEHMHGVIHVVNNLSSPQTLLFYSQTSPNTFLPHVGLFVSDFAMGSQLTKK